MRPSPSRATSAPCCTPWFAWAATPARTADSAAACSGRSRVVSTTRSSVGSWPISASTWASSQSVKYWARWLARVAETCTGWANAASRWAAVIAPMLTMAFSTTVARLAARSLLAAGL